MDETKTKRNFSIQKKQKKRGWQTQFQFLLTENLSFGHAYEHAKVLVKKKEIAEILLFFYSTIPDHTTFFSLFIPDC